MNSNIWQFGGSNHSSGRGSNLPVAGPSSTSSYETPSRSSSFNSTSDQRLQEGFVSPRGLFKATHFLTLEGTTGWPIRASVTFNPQTSDVVFLRLVLGKKALTTSVTQLAGREHGVWQLEAITPHPNEILYGSIEVPLVVQSLRDDGDIMDSLIIGSFTYRHGNSSLSSDQGTPTMRQSSIDSAHIPYHSDTSEQPIPDAVSRSQSGSSSRPPSSRSKSAKASRHPVQGKKQVLMRTRRTEPGEDLGECHRVIFDLLTPLDTLSNSWTREEIYTGRRLIRFTSRIDGVRLRVSCQRITQDEYSEGDAVISCIYRRDNGNCYFTSVDIICLLESLVGEGFEIEEKNRIRRNLEGFHPQTVSKNRKDSEEFFQQIMDFPAPKPRHIEKDVKVFNWGILGQALEKIISKYSLYTQVEEPAPVLTHQYPQRYSSSPSELGIPAVVPSHPQPDSYHSSSSRRSPYSVDSRYPPEQNVHYSQYGSEPRTRQQSLPHHREPIN